MTVRKIASLAREGEPHNILPFRGLPSSDSPSNDLSPSGDLPSPSGVPMPQTLTPRLSTTTNRYMTAGQKFPRTEKIKIVESTSASEAMKLAGQFDMDAGRINALKTVQGKLGAFSASEATHLVGLFDMDAGRTSALKTVQGKLGAFSASEATNLVGLFDMDAGRTSALETVQGKLGAFSASEATNLVGLFDMDAGRTSALETVQGKLGAFSVSEATNLVGLFDMDSGRNYAQNIAGSRSCTVDQMNLLHLTGRGNVAQRSFRNYSVGGDSVQFDVSINQDTGDRTSRIIGHFSDETLRQSFGI